MITNPLVLPNDVVLVPVRRLSAQVRQQMECEDDDFAITRPRSRTPSKIVDPDTAGLLEEFRTPRTVVEAILRYSRAMKTDPEETLDAAFPVIENLVKSRLLVQADSGESSEIVASYRAGDAIDGFTVLRCVQVLEDTELYHVQDLEGRAAALKIARLAGDAMRRTFARERAVLEHLDGQASPRFLAEGAADGKHYLAMEWCPGVNVMEAADELRRQGSRARLLDLACGVLRAYAHLHSQAVIHGDVHPRNVLVAPDGAVKIIDFGLARLRTGRNEFSRAGRGGIAYFFEPEYARARLAGKRPPAASRAGEQYSLAVLAYLLLAGAHYVDFSVEKREVWRQIAEGAPLPFANRGLPAWSAVEAVLAVALSKHSPGRYESVADFAASLAGAAASEPAAAPIAWVATSPVDLAPMERFLDLVLQRVGQAGALFAAAPAEAPTASVKMGAAGVAYGLHRIAGVRDDARLLAMADLWADRAERLMGREDAFYNAEIDLTPAVLGPATPYHTASGVYAVQALIAHARGDFVSQQASADAFVRAAAMPCDNPDLTLGRSGVLLIASLLLDTMHSSKLLDPSRLREFGGEVMQGVWEQLAPYGSVCDDKQLAYLGVAHGWAGVLYATLRWSQVSGQALPPAVEPRLRQLAECAEPSGHGLRWRRKNARHARERSYDYLSSWCNGSAGFIFLWTLAHRLLGDADYLALAEGAAWHAWEDGDAIGDLCCGLSGRAYGLLNLYKHTGDRQWLHRGQELAVRSVDAVQRYALRRDGLYKGEIGVAALAADLSRPEEACMPFFEPEGWQAPGGA